MKLKRFICGILALISMSAFSVSNAKEFLSDNVFSEEVQENTTPINKTAVIVTANTRNVFASGSIKNNDGVEVSQFELDGSFLYDGTSSSVDGSSKFHNPKKAGYTCTYSESRGISGTSSFLQCTFTCTSSAGGSKSVTVKITVDKNGKETVTGASKYKKS